MVKHGLEGVVELGIVQNLDSDRYVSDVRSIETGGTQNCIFSPSPYMGIMPLEGALVATYKKQGWWSRLLIPVADMVGLDTRSIEDGLNDLTPEPPGTVELMEPGECYFGRFGRVYFDKNGSSKMYNVGKNLSLTLNNLTSRADLVANNFNFSTPGGGIRIRSSSSIPSTFGDILRIENNVPLPSIPEEINPSPAIPSNISFLEFDAVGGVTMSAAVGTALLSLSAPDVTLGPNIIGNIRLKNAVSGLTLSPVGNVSLSTTGSSLSMLPVGTATISATSGITLSSASTTVTGSVTYSAAGGSTSTSLGAFSLICPSFTVTSPLMSLSGNLVVSGTMNVVGVPSYTGVDLTASPVPLSGLSAISKIPVLINTPTGVVVGFIQVTS